MVFLWGLMPPRPNGLDNTNNTPKILTKAFHPPKIPRCDILKPQETAQARPKGLDLIHSYLHLRHIHPHLLQLLILLRECFLQTRNPGAMQLSPPDLFLSERANSCLQLKMLVSGLLERGRQVLTPLQTMQGFLNAIQLFAQVKRREGMDRIPRRGRNGLVPILQRRKSPEDLLDE